MGYKPWEFHRITFREVCLAIEGLNEQNNFYDGLLGKTAYYISASGFNGKIANEVRRHWLGEKRKATGKISERALEQLRQLRVVEAQKSALEKIKKDA